MGRCPCSLVFSAALTALLLLVGPGCELTNDPAADAFVPSTDVSDGDVTESFGVVKWTFVFDKEGLTEEAGMGSVALSDAGDIYALANPIGGARIAYSIAPDGTRNWKFTDFDYPEAGSCADPVFSNRSNTLYVVCDLGNWAGVEDRGFETFVTAISSSGEKRWTTGFPPIEKDGEEQRNPLTASKWAVALRPDPDNGADQLYVGTGAFDIEGIPAKIYIFEQNGDVTETDYASQKGIAGLAFGPGDLLHVLDYEGRLEVFGSGLTTLWHYEQPEANQARGTMAFDSQGRVFLPLHGTPGVRALHRDLDPSGHLQWWLPTAGEPGPPSIDANGRVGVTERGKGLMALSAADGSVVWQDPLYGYSGELAQAALADGVVVASLESSQAAFDENGDRVPSVMPAQMTGISAVADDGTLYVFGRAGIEGMYPTTLYAARGSAALSATWTRHRGNNANTARYEDCVEP